MSNYAIISLGGKQYRVREGERLLVDRVKTDEGKTFHPDILFAIWMADLRLIPSRIEATCGGVTICAVADKEDFSPEPSQTKPRSSSRIASS